MKTTNYESDSQLQHVDLTGSKGISLQKDYPRVPVSAADRLNSFLLKFGAWYGRLPSGVLQSPSEYY
jgi:uncharacterized protein (DUF488 family)